MLKHASRVKLEKAIRKKEKGELDRGDLQTEEDLYHLE